MDELTYVLTVQDGKVRVNGVDYYPADPEGYYDGCLEGFNLVFTQIDAAELVLRGYSAQQQVAMNANAIEWYLCWRGWYPTKEKLIDMLNVEPDIHIRHWLSIRIFIGYGDDAFMVRVGNELRQG